MSEIINPHTGQSLNSERRNQELAQLIMAIKHIDGKLNALTQQQVHLGLYTEFLSEKLLAMTKEDGSPLLPIDMNEFPGWAEKRMEEIRGEAEAVMQQAHAQTMSTADTQGIVLDDSE